jgi:hypothetical protein
MGLQLSMRLERPEHLQAALTGLVEVNRTILRGARARGRPLPSVYDERQRVVYKREPPGVESWKTITEILRDRCGDCEDLASAVAAEYQEAGEDARAIVIKTGHGRYHAIVERADGSREDPSKILHNRAKARRRKAQRK